MSGRPPPLPPTSGAIGLDDLSRMVPIRQILRHQTEEHRLPVRPASEQDDPGTEPVAELVAEIPEGLDVGGLHDGRQDIDPVDLPDAAHQIAGILRRQFPLERLDLPLQFPFTPEKLFRSVRRFQKTDLQQTGRLPEFVLQAPHMGDSRVSRHRLDPADAGGDGRLMDDLQKADVAGPGHMGPAAEFAAESAHPDDADRLPVLLVEDRRRPGLHRLRKRHDRGLHGNVRPDHPVGLLLDPRQFLLLDLRKMGEIEAEPLGVHQGAGLLDMLSEDLLQRGLEKMGPGMVGLGRPAGLVGHLQIDRIPLAELSAFEFADMGDQIIERPFRIRHIEDD